MLEKLGVIFDMDGVITVNNHIHLEVWEEYAVRFGKNIHDFPGSIFGKTNQAIIEVLWAGEGLSQEQINELAEGKEAAYREAYRPQFQLNAGLAQWLETVKAAGVPMAVATNAPGSNLHFTLEVGQLHDYFQGWVHLGDVKQGKPDPEIYQKAIGIVGREPGNCVIFEDSFTGIEAGKKAGAKVIAIASTYPAEKLAEVADKVIPDFVGLTLDDLLQLIQG